MPSRQEQADDGGQPLHHAPPSLRWATRRRRSPTSRRRPTSPPAPSTSTSPPRNPSCASSARRTSWRSSRSPAASRRPAGQGQGARDREDFKLMFGLFDVSYILHSARDDERHVRPLRAGEHPRQRIHLLQPLQAGAAEGGHGSPTRWWPCAPPSSWGSHRHCNDLYRFRKKGTFDEKDLRAFYRHATSMPCGAPCAGRCSSTVPRKELPPCSTSTSTCSALMEGRALRAGARRSPTAAGARPHLEGSADALDPTRARIPRLARGDPQARRPNARSTAAGRAAALDHLEQGGQRVHRAVTCSAGATQAGRWRSCAQRLHQPVGRGTKSYCHDPSRVFHGPSFVTLIPSASGPQPMRRQGTPSRTPNSPGSTRSRPEGPSPRPSCEIPPHLASQRSRPCPHRPPPVPRHGQPRARRRRLLAPRMAAQRRANGSRQPLTARHAASHADRRTSPQWIHGQHVAYSVTSP